MNVSEGEVHSPAERWGSYRVLKQLRAACETYYKTNDRSIDRCGRITRSAWTSMLEKNDTTGNRENPISVCENWEGRVGGGGGARVGETERRPGHLISAMGQRAREQGETE